jgi:hypothetical protein
MRGRGMGRENNEENEEEPTGMGDKWTRGQKDSSIFPKKWDNSLTH